MYNVLLDDVAIADIIQPTVMKSVFVAPSTIQLAGAEIELVSQMARETVLKAALEGIKDEFDYVFIDCPPALSQSTYNAMAVATGLLIPVQMEGLSVNGLGNIIVAMREVQSELNPNLELRGLLPTMVDARPRIVREFIDYLKRSYGDNVCETVIRRSVRMNEAQTMLKDIYAYKQGQWSSVANDYDELTKELFNL